MAYNFNAMSVEELWALHEGLALALAERLTSEKAMLEARLDQLNQTRSYDGAQEQPLERKKRPYPAVIPKYRNPANPSELWSGRGKQPRWLVALLKTGKDIEEFRLPTRPDARAAAARVGARRVKATDP